MAICFFTKLPLGSHGPLNTALALDVLGGAITAVMLIYFHT